MKVEKMVEGHTAVVALFELVLKTVVASAEQTEVEKTGRMVVETVVAVCIALVWVKAVGHTAVEQEQVMEVVHIAVLEEAMEAVHTVVGLEQVTVVAHTVVVSEQATEVLHIVAVQEEAMEVGHTVVVAQDGTV